jgi:hypothetical protein
MKKVRDLQAKDLRIVVANFSKFCKDALIERNYFETRDKCCKGEVEKEEYLKIGKQFASEISALLEKKDLKTLKKMGLNFYFNCILENCEIDRSILNILYDFEKEKLIILFWDYDGCIELDVKLKNIIEEVDFSIFYRDTLNRKVFKKLKKDGV